MNVQAIKIHAGTCAPHVRAMLHSMLEEHAAMTAQAQQHAAIVAELNAKVATLEAQLAATFALKEATTA